MIKVILRECPIVFKKKIKRDACPRFLDDSDYTWSDRRQRRFDEQYLDNLVPDAKKYRAPGDPKRPVSLEKWNKYKHIFGY